MRQYAILFAHAYMSYLWLGKRYPAYIGDAAKKAIKAVYRFFRHITEHPRFVTTFIQKVRNGIDSDLLGVSTITWWDKLTISLGKLENTKPLYSKFRKCIT